MALSRALLAALLALALSCGASPLGLQPAVASFFKLQTAVAKVDCAAWVALFNDTFTLEDPNGSDPITSKADLLACCEGTNAVFSTISLLPVSAFPAGDGAAVVWKCNSTAPALENNGTACVLNFTGVDVFSTTQDGSLITAMHGFFDTSLPADQLKPCTPGPL